MDFTGQSAIVTGAARGIGLVVAQRLMEAGATVFMVDVREELLRSAAAGIGATACPADVSDTKQVEQVVASAVDATGRIDVLFNNAGLLRDKVLWKIDDEDWESVVGVSLGGTFRFTRACVPTFRRLGYGRIVNVTSYTGLHGNFGQANYAAAKAGVIGFTKTAAKELARFGVTVNAISPNAHTAMTASMPPERFAEFEQATPLGRIADPAEIADGVLFLASREAGYITGVVLAVDGGMSM